MHARCESLEGKAVLIPAPAGFGSYLAPGCGFCLCALETDARKLHFTLATVPT
jgi:hypothetical protein